MMTPNNTLNSLALMLCLVAAAPFRSFSQSDEVLAAPTVSGLVVLGVQNDAKTLLMTGNRHATDVVNFDNAAPYKGDLILLRNAGFNVSYNTVNPLRYQVSVKRTGITSDGYQETLQSLLTSVTSIITATSGGELPTGPGLDHAAIPMPTADRLQNAWLLNYPDLAKFDNPSLANNSKEDKGLRDRKLKSELLQIRLLAQRSAEATNVQSLCNDLDKKVQDVEQLAGFDYITKAAPLIKQLFEVDFTNKHADSDIDKVLNGVRVLERANNKLDSVLKILGQWKVLTEGDLLKQKEELELKGEKDKVKSLGKTSTVSAELAGLLDQSFKEAKNRLDALLAARKSVAAQISQLATWLNKEKGVVDYSKDRVHRIFSSTLPKDSVAKFTLTVKERWYEVDNSFNITHKDSLFFQRDLRLMKTHTFYPQVFPAVIFSDLSVRTYALKNDTLTEGGPDEKPIKVAGMVNFNFKMGTKQEVPFLQLGASFLKSRPILYTGVGCRFTEWFGISFGAMFAWRPDLTDLKVGDVVKDQATLDKDLSFQFMRPSFYLGVQFRPASLTTNK